MYESFYNLQARPFQLSPDPRFFFSSRTHKRALAYLRYGIEQGEGFIVITGDVGTGKTMLVSRLFQSFDNQKVVAARIVSTQLQAKDLLRVAAAEFGLAYEQVTKAALLRSLEQFFKNCMRDGQRVLLVVDEAQNLPMKSIEELRMLSNFQWEGRPLLHSFLLGQKEFRSMMRSEGFEQVRQRVIAAYHLRPLDAAETRQYIEHRLKLVGWHGDPEIPPETFQGIHEHTGGIPRKTNLLCDRLLLYGSLEEIHVLDSDTLEAVLEDVREELWSSETETSLPAFDESSGDADLPQIGPNTDLDPNAPDEHTGGEDRDRRLSELEQSMKELTGALRDELGRLRQAIDKRTDDEEDERED